MRKMLFYVNVELSYMYKGYVFNLKAGKMLQRK